MQLRDGETIGEYVMRIERRLKELEPPDGFTIQEWHIGQVYAYLLWRDPLITDGDEAARLKWSGLIGAFEERFPDKVKKFSDYMGWNE